MANETGPHIAIMRSELSRARGLGAAKTGYHHWWAQRLTAVALVPLTLWFVINIVGLNGAPHAVVVAWLANPLTLVLMLALIAALFHHIQLGLQVVIEDYVHTDACRVVAVLVMKGAVALLALAAAVAALKMGI